MALVRIAMVLAAAATFSAAQGGGKAPQSPRSAKPISSPFDAPRVEDDGPFVERVNEAIARGESWLLAAQAPGGAWQGEAQSGRMGITELALYALASSAGDADAERAQQIAKAIDSGIAFVRSVPVQETYALSLLLLMLDARAQPPWERASLPRMSPAERERYTFPRRLAAADKTWLDSIVRELVEHRFRGMWHYGRSPDTGDISNTQFALLGLRAASNCGTRVSPKMLLETIEAFVDGQEDDGPPVTFPVPRFSGASIQEIVSVEARQRCWGYKGYFFAPPAAGAAEPRTRPPRAARGKIDASGTHAAIGIACLQIARDEVERAQRRQSAADVRDSLRTLTPSIDRAIRDGLGWLAAHWNLETDPGGGRPYYYLYSVERVGALLNDRFVAGHDWYREGAEILLRRQRPDGSWPASTGAGGANGAPDVINTAFALLFLRRATTPGVITPSFR